MKKIRTISNITLTLVMILFSAGMTLGVHRCEGAVKHIAINDMVDSCHKQKMPVGHGCHDHNPEDVGACCQVDFETSTVNKNDAVIAPHVSLPLASLLPLYEFDINLALRVYEQQTYKLKTPLIIRDLIPLIQSFLI